jgi:hypothetical protein
VIVLLDVFGGTVPTLLLFLRSLTLLVEDSNNSPVVCKKCQSQEEEKSNLSSPFLSLHWLTVCSEPEVDFGTEMSDEEGFKRDFLLFAIFVIA